MRLPSLIALLLVPAGLVSAASPSSSPRPLLGAQVWIEPGQTPEQIDGWFATLAGSGS
jgi:hypothetical protein